MRIRQNRSGFVHLPLELTEGHGVFEAVRVNGDIVLTAVDPTPTITLEEAFGIKGAELAREALDSNERDRREGMHGRRITDLSAYFSELEALM